MPLEFECWSLLSVKSEERGLLFHVFGYRFKPQICVSHHFSLRPLLTQLSSGMVASMICPALQISTPGLGVTKSEHTNTTLYIIPSTFSSQTLTPSQHGSGTVNKYINLSPDYKNPADGGSKQGAKFTLDSTAFWNGQTMRRTELIPQTKAAIASGKVWYHFSIKRSGTNAPSIYREHQICFFESHFTELKSGWISGATGNSDTRLQWFVGGKSQWSVEWTPDVWHNVAYEIVCLSSPTLPP
jgi:hypothetical protein